MYNNFLGIDFMFLWAKHGLEFAPSGTDKTKPRKGLGGHERLSSLRGTQYKVRT